MIFMWCGCSISTYTHTHVECYTPYAMMKFPFNCSSNCYRVWVCDNSCVLFVLILWTIFAKITNGNECGYRKLDVRVCLCPFSIRYTTFMFEYSFAHIFIFVRLPPFPTPFDSCTSTIRLGNAFKLVFRKAKHLNIAVISKPFDWTMVGNFDD